MNTIPDTTEIVKQTQDAITSGKAMIVTSPEGMELAAKFLRGVKTIRKRIGDTFDGPIAAAHAAHKSILAAKAEHDKPLAEAERIVKGRVGAYQQEEERKRQAEERRLRDVARKEEEDRRLAEAQRLEAEAAAKRAEAERQAENGKTLTAEIKEREADEMTQAADATLAAPIPEPTVYVPTTVPKVAGVQTRQVWKHRITDMSLIPREYLVPNETMLGAVARGSRGQARIPGVEFYPEANVAVSGYGR